MVLTAGLLWREARTVPRSAVQVGGWGKMSSVCVGGETQVVARSLPGLVLGLCTEIGADVALLWWVAVSLAGGQGSSSKTANLLWHSTVSAVIAVEGLRGGNVQDPAVRAGHFLVHAADHVEGPGRREGSGGLDGVEAVMGKNWPTVMDPTVESLL